MLLSNLFNGLASDVSSCIMIRNNKKVKSDYDLIDTFSSMESNYGNMKKKRLDLGDMQAVSSLKYPQAISICPIYFPYLHSLSCY